MIAPHSTQTALTRESSNRVHLLVSPRSLLMSFRAPLARSPLSMHLASLSRQIISVRLHTSWDNLEFASDLQGATVFKIAAAAGLEGQP